MPSPVRFLRPLLTIARLARTLPCLLLGLSCCLGSCRTPSPQSGFRVELDGERVAGRFLAIEGAGDHPAAGDLLTWPELVLDDASSQTFVRRGERTYRVEGTSERLVAIEVDAPDELRSMSDETIGGLRAIRFDRWQPAMAAELERVDVRRCLLSFGPLSDALELTSLPAATRYLDMHYAEPVEPAGFARFAEMRYLVVPDEPWSDPEGPPPPPPARDGPEGSIPLDWVCHLPELRWLDVLGVGHDLRPLGGHAKLRHVSASHCRIGHLPTRPMPSLVAFVLSFSDCPDGELQRMRRMHPTARILRTPGEVLRERVCGAAGLLLRTGSSCHPKPTDRVVYRTDDPAEIDALLERLQSRQGYAPVYMVPGCDSGVMVFLDERGEVLAEVGMLGAQSLRCYQTWSLMPAFLDSKERGADLRAWLSARGLEIG